MPALRVCESKPKMVEPLLEGTGPASRKLGSSSLGRFLRLQLRAWSGRALLQKGFRLFQS